MIVFQTVESYHTVIRERCFVDAYFVVDLGDCSVIPGAPHTTDISCPRVCAAGRHTPAPGDWQTALRR